MVFPAPPTLLKLVSQGLVRDEGLNISALGDLPSPLFLPLFKEANIQRKAKMIKILVKYWPYLCLHIGLLINKPNFQTFQAILDGVDTWLKQKYRTRMCRLQVVHLNEYHASSAMQDGRKGRDYLGETMLKKQQVEEGQSRCTTKRLRLFRDLSFMSSLHEDRHQTQLLQWAKGRKDFLHLCCEKLEIGAIEWPKVRDVLQLLQPDSIKELELNTVGNLSKLAKFVPHISKMRTLQKLMLRCIFGTRTSTGEEKRNVTKIISLFPKLSSLQHLTIDDVYFLTDNMKELFRCLEAPLVSLEITLCQLSQADLKSFAQHWNYSQLKHLCLRGTTLTELDVNHLGDFLKNVTDNLQTLNLENCRMSDSHLSNLLPALIKCSQLTSINLYDNNISKDALKNFLLHTTNLSLLTTEMYPAPLEVYNESKYVEVDTFSQYCAELWETLMGVRQPNSVSFGSYSCYDCDEHYLYEDGDLIHCLCQE
ncbi:preferentially expressed antigen in melanoma-like protein 7 [Mastomys coucha]|uniref:preferentially expressed antigen in melanoma-like protein 7 n=1 Tax=Mastomys coucha TaxID=35658 RepID=UPI001261A257|nr:preferentially expressed antigen in melanoma-like protein 7 [Mastomys coucha]